eukprot:8679081-Prorocentrum_lima.AAC.1
MGRELSRTSRCVCSLVSFPPWSPFAGPRGGSTGERLLFAPSGDISDRSTASDRAEGSLTVDPPDATLSMDGLPNNCGLRTAAGKL